MRRRHGGHGGIGEQITSVDIAVSGINGTAGRAQVYNPEGTGTEQYFPDPWSEAVDGTDNYLGSTEKDAPYMRGFTIQVDHAESAVCQSAYIHDADWLPTACDNPGDKLELTYAGAQANDLWFEAVRLTV